MKYIIGFFLFLIGGASFNAFATDTDRTRESIIPSLDEEATPDFSSFSVERSPTTQRFDKKSRQKNKKNKVWDTIHNAVKNILSSSEENNITKVTVKNLEIELKEKVLSDHLTMPQVIELLKKRISGKQSRPFMRNTEIQVLGELLKIHTLIGSTILEIVDLLEELYSSKESNAHIKSSAIEATGVILERYALLDFFPNKKTSHILNQLTKKLFDDNIYVREDTGRVIVKLLSQEIVPESEKRDIAFSIAYRMFNSDWQKKILALKVLGELLILNIPSDPTGKRQIVLMISDQLDDDSWDVRKEVINILRECLIQNIVSDPSEKREIALIMSARLEDGSWEVRQEVVESAPVFLSQGVLSDTETLNIWHQIARLIYDGPTVGNAAAEVITDLWNSNLLPFHEKTEILHAMATGLADASYRRDKVLEVLKAAVKAGLPPVIDIIHEKWCVSNNWSVRHNAMDYLYALSNHNILSDPMGREKIFLMISGGLADKDERVRKEAVQVLNVFLRRELLPDLKKSGIWLQIAKLVFDENEGVRYLVGQTIKNLWKSDFPPSENKEILRAIAEELPHASHGKYKALKLLRSAIHSGIIPGLGIISNVIGQVSEPAPIGIEAEKFVRKYLKIVKLPFWREAKFSFALKRQIAKRNSPNPRQRGRSKDCKKHWITNDQ